ADRETPTAPTDHRAALAPRRDAVVALRVHGRGDEIALPADRDTIAIGAGRRCDVRIDDPYTTTIHSTLERRPDGRLLVRDRRSKNGTFINGNRVEVGELRVGAVLTVGRTGLLALGRRAGTAPSAREALVGEDPAFRAALDKALLAAATSCNVLIV